jgi:hypothetical protein
MNFKTSRFVILAILISLILAGCASSPDKIQAAYVSPLKYKDYDCDQLAMEMDYVGQRTNRLYQELDNEATADKWQMGVGLLLFWPTLFALEGGDSSEAVEYAQLKGEFEAIRTTSVQKKCGVEYESINDVVPATTTTSVPTLRSEDTLSSISEPSKNATIELEEERSLVARDGACNMPVTPDAISKNLNQQDILTEKRRIQNFQQENKAYRRCLTQTIDSQPLSNTERNKLISLHNSSLTIEQAVVDEFNLALAEFEESQ